MAPNNDKIQNNQEGLGAGGGGSSNITTTTTTTENEHQETIPAPETNGGEPEMRNKNKGTKDMNVRELLAVKLRGDELADGEIEFLVQKITDGSLDDVQLGKKYR